MAITSFAILMGPLQPPISLFARGTNISPGHAFLPWFCQNKLIQNALMASVEPTIASIVATADSAKSAWHALHTTSAKKSQTRVLRSSDFSKLGMRDSVNFHNNKTLPFATTITSFITNS